MDRNRIKSIFESLLFVWGDTLRTRDLAELAGITPEEAAEILEEMAEEFRAEERGISLIQLNDAWQLCSKHENYDYIIKMTHRPRKYQLTEGQL
ncbi:MAG: SMC-Scp complex subunit ScpB [Lachnospiraceae bacterium]|nr:SMC-Scp complex subunit ScpB [Lachnospiraceae bacterium]